jgi:hypothetical protein
MEQESQDHIQKTLHPFPAAPTDSPSAGSVEAIQRVRIQLPGEGSQDASSPHLPTRSKGLKRGRGQSTPHRMVASSAARKGKGQGTPALTPNESPRLGPHILSQDKFPMTNEYLTMCQEVWNCTRKHAQDAYPLTHMGVVVGLFHAKQ